MGSATLATSEWGSIGIGFASIATEVRGSGANDGAGFIPISVRLANAFFEVVDADAIAVRGLGFT